MKPNKLSLFLSPFLSCSLAIGFFFFLISLSKFQHFYNTIYKFFRRKFQTNKNNSNSTLILWSYYSWGFFFFFFLTKKVLWGFENLQTLS